MLRRCLRAVKNYMTDEKLEGQDLSDIQEFFEILEVTLQETVDYIEANPNESMETYSARRTELQEAADPVVEHLRAVYEEIRQAEENPPCVNHTAAWQPAGDW